MTTKDDRQRSEWKQIVHNHLDVAHELIANGGAANLEDSELIEIGRKLNKTLKYVNQLLTIRGEH